MPRKNFTKEALSKPLAAMSHGPGWHELSPFVTFCHPVLGARRERAYKGLIAHSKLYLFFTFSLPLSHFYRSNRSADARLEPDGQAPDNR